MNKVIAVDVDLTVVDSLSPWFDWYYKRTNHSIMEDLNQLIDKGGKVEADKLMHMHHQPNEYWHQEDLYDNLTPIKGCIDVLKELSTEYDIIFVSHSFPKHTNSKELFIKRFFPFYKAFISTKAKGYVNADIFIDDYEPFLDSIAEINPDCELIMHKSVYNKDSKKYLPLTWEEIKRTIG